MVVSGKNLARWYREVSQHLRAGIPLPKAFEMAGGAPGRDRRRLAERLRAGEPVAEVLHQAPRWFPVVDRRVLASAAASGQMVETLQVLSEKRAFSSNQARRAIAAMAYPLFVIHVAMLVLPIFVVGIESMQAYLTMVLSLWLPLWAVIAGVTWSVRTRRGWIQGIMALLPLLRGHLKNRGLADLCFTLRAYLAAGATIDVAWAGAAGACGSRRLRRMGMKIADEARVGTPPGTQVGEVRGLPEDFVSLYQAGELTGQLDENLHHLWRLYDERAADKLCAASFWYPMLLVLGAAIAVAYIAVMAFSAYVEGLMEMM